MKSKLFLYFAIGVVVALIGMGVSGYFAYSAKGEMEEAQDSRASAWGTLVKLHKENPFPNKDNVDSLKEDVRAYEDVFANARGREEPIVQICHHMEDPTFDATAAATNPKMVMRPIHRPPRVDGPNGSGAGRWPVCRWAVSIGEASFPWTLYDSQTTTGVASMIALTSSPEVRVRGSASFSFAALIASRRAWFAAEVIVR